MADERSERFGFAAAHDAPIPYLQRIRDYYLALGYGAPYEWAHYAQVPFQRLRKLLARCRVALVTTAAPYQPDKGDQGPGAPYNASAKFYAVYSGDTSQDHDLRISHVAIDRKHTTAEDAGTYFPLPELRRAAARGRIGTVAPRFHGVADQSQPSHHARSRLPRTRCPLQGRCRRCRRAGCQLSGLPSERQPRRARAGGGRHCDRRHGLRQGHCRVCRRTAAVVLRLSARQCGRPAERSRNRSMTRLSLR